MIQMHQQQVDLHRLKEIRSPGGRFKTIVVKAFNKEGVKNIHDIDQCIRWAVGNAYAYLPYQFWGEEIMKRHREIKFPPFVPIFITMRAVARLWRREQRLKMGTW